MGMDEFVWYLREPWLALPRLVFLYLEDVELKRNMFCITCDAQFYSPGTRRQTLERGLERSWAVGAWECLEKLRGVGALRGLGS